MTCSQTPNCVERGRRHILMDRHASRRPQVGRVSVQPVAAGELGSCRAAASRARTALMRATVSASSCPKLWRKAVIP